MTQPEHPSRRLVPGAILLVAVAGLIALAVWQWGPWGPAAADADETAGAAGRAAGNRSPDESPGRQDHPEPDAAGTDREPVVPIDPEDDMPENPFPDRVRAPEDALDGGIEWFNTAEPLELGDLEGKVVLLDFWTYCCINCMHVLPDLEQLEEDFPNELVVVGVHSGKFDNERDSENIREAILRYEIAHPVVNDADMRIWRRFGVRAWPTLVLIDPEGYVLGFVSGEGNYELLREAIQQVIAYHRHRGTLDERVMRFELERDWLTATPLLYPGKVLADEASGRLFIADSNHNRIVVATLPPSPEGGEGGATRALEVSLLDIIGSGAAGADDGPFEQATFDHPQGMALDGNVLYVADTENHLIRRIDLESRVVTTIAGTGEPPRFRGRGGPPLETAISSPWDLVMVDGVLYVAMAGPHQIWRLDFESDVIEPHSGSGREDIIDGPPIFAAHAQPSGITTDGTWLYVADCEGSAIRAVPLASHPEGMVQTLAGTHDLGLGRSLFEFGDTDGTGDEARLQHPLGVVYHEGRLYVADTYNHKVRVIELGEPAAIGPAECRTLVGDGQSGDRDAPPRFHEPGGISVAAGRLFVADTNNHRIRVVDLATRQVQTLEIAGLEPPLLPPQAAGE